jgi:hypothetical protein
MHSLLVWILALLMAGDCAAYLWGMSRWMRYLRAQRLPELPPADRARALSTPEYRRLRALARLPVTLAALLFVAMMLVARG